VFTLGIGTAVLGVGERNYDLLLGAGWVVNLLVAELVIWRTGRRRTGRRTGRARTTVSA
jgi:hypothetical protein